MDSYRKPFVADLSMQKAPFVARAIYACIRYPLIEAIAYYFDGRARKIHEELGDNGVYLSWCMSDATHSRQKALP